MPRGKVRHLICKAGRFYWQPSAELRAKGWAPERLPDDLVAAERRAEELNRHLDAVRAGQHARPQRAVVVKGRQHPRGRRPSSGVSGVYVVGAGAGEPVKIGIASDVAGRLLQLQTGSSRRLRIYFYRSANYEHAATIERWTHEQFAHARVAGEWFKVNADDVVQFVLQAFADVRLPAICTSS